MPEYRVNLVRTLRAEQTDSEERLWEHLQGRRLDGLKFRRQRPIGRYVADFCCDEQKLIVEIDGSVHDHPEQREYDAVRSEWLTAVGYRIVHVTPDQVLYEVSRVLARIRDAALTPNPAPAPVRSSLGRGEKDCGLASYSPLPSEE